MHVNSTVAQMVSHPHNLASARATGFPVLRSLDAAAVVLGYSLTYLNQVPISVEVNHLYAEGVTHAPCPSRRGRTTVGSLRSHRISACMTMRYPTA